MAEDNEFENFTSLTQQMPGCERSHDNGSLKMNSLKSQMIP
jgi:hypothetical protein